MGCQLGQCANWFADSHQGCSGPHNEATRPDVCMVLDLKPPRRRESTNPDSNTWTQQLFALDLVPQNDGWQIPTFLREFGGFRYPNPQNSNLNLGHCSGFPFLLGRLRVQAPGFYLWPLFFFRDLPPFFRRGLFLGGFLRGPGYRKHRAFSADGRPAPSPPEAEASRAPAGGLRAQDRGPGAAQGANLPAVGRWAATDRSTVDPILG